MVFVVILLFHPPKKEDFCFNWLVAYGIFESVTVTLAIIYYIIRYFCFRQSKEMYYPIHNGSVAVGGITTAVDNSRLKCLESILITVVFVCSTMLAFVGFSIASFVHSAYRGVTLLLSGIAFLNSISRLI